MYNDDSVKEDVYLHSIAMAILLHCMHVCITSDDIITYQSGHTQKLFTVKNLMDDL